VATDGQGAQSTSATRTIKVNAANLPPTVNLTSPANNAVVNAPATIALKANASAPEANDTVARVDFFDGATLVGSATAAPYSATIANAAAGAHVLTAVATDGQGAQTTSAARTVTVAVAANQPPAVALTSPANGATFTAPATVPLTASASDADGSIAKVDFFQGATLIGTATAAPYTFSWTNVAQGSYAITARATDNGGAVTTSAVVNITVNSAVAQMYYIAPDHLNTPRLIADSTGTTVWRWDQAEPFGATPPNTDPDGDGAAFDFPFRFPGQYFDRETALHYNTMREYDSSIGRYVESDPIGLKGSLNTYSYVLGNPVSFGDLFGLRACGDDPPKPSCRGVCQFVEDAEEKCKCEHRCRMVTCGVGVRCILSSVNTQRNCIASAVGGTGKGKDGRPAPRGPSDD
jgi:RHS repeat-associated protein